MKRANLMITMTVLLLSGLAAAQLKSDEKIVAQVPFEFTAANRVIPAGQCTVQSMPRNPRTLMVRNIEAKAGLFAMATVGETKTPAGRYALVFKRYGNQYFLSGIKLGGTKTTYQLPENKAEAELRAQNATSSEEILVASLQ